MAGHDVLGEPAEVRHAIGVVAQSRRRSTARRPGARTCACRARSTAWAAAALEQRIDGLLEPLRPHRRRRPPGAHVLGRDAAAPRHRHGARAPARGPLPRRADHRAGPGGPRRHVGRDRPPDRRGPDRPADHPLPRGGRPRWPRSWRSSTGARSWRRARPTSSSATCTATPSRSSSRDDEASSRAGAAWTAAAAGEISSSTTASCTRAPRTAHAPCRRCCTRSRPRASGSASVTVARPSLDDVYLRHAGRTFDAAETETENHRHKEEEPMTPALADTRHMTVRHLMALLAPALVDRRLPGAADRSGCCCSARCSRRWPTSPASPATTTSFLAPGVVVMTALFACGWAGCRSSRTWSAASWTASWSPRCGAAR